MQNVNTKLGAPRILEKKITSTYWIPPKYDCFWHTNGKFLLFFKGNIPKSQGQKWAACQKGVLSLRGQNKAVPQAICP